jgi:hypothetical protein
MSLYLSLTPEQREDAAQLYLLTRRLMNNSADQSKATAAEKQLAIAENLINNIERILTITKRNQWQQITTDEARAANCEVIIHQINFYKKRKINMSYHQNQIRAARRAQEAAAQQKPEAPAMPMLSQAELDNQELIKELAAAKLHINSLHAAISAVRTADGKQKGLASVQLYKLVDDNDKALIDALASDEDMF